MIWKQKQILGRPNYYGYLDDEKIWYIDTLLDCVYAADLRDNPTKFYMFTNIDAAKTICEASLEDKTVLDPYIDRDWERLREKGKQIIEQSKKTLKNVDGNKS